jgi:hypothetical protein
MCLGILSRVEVSPNFSPLKNFPKASTQLTDYHLNRQALDIIRITARRFYTTHRLIQTCITN